MAEAVDSIIAELIVKNEAYVRGFNEATAAHERFLKSTTALKANTFDLQAEGQKYKQGASAIQQAEEQTTQVITKAKKAQSDAAKQASAAEKQAAKDAAAAVKAAEKEKADAAKAAAKERAAAAKAVAKEEAAAAREAQQRAAATAEAERRLAVASQNATRQQIEDLERLKAAEREATNQAKANAFLTGGSNRNSARASAAVFRANAAQLDAAEAARQTRPTSPSFIGPLQQPAVTTGANGPRQLFRSDGTPYDPTPRTFSGTRASDAIAGKNAQAARDEAEAEAAALADEEKKKEALATELVLRTRAKYEAQAEALAAKDIAENIRLVNGLRQKGISDERIAIELEELHAARVKFRAEQEEKRALVQHASGRSGFGGANEAALSLTGGRFGYSFSPAAIAGAAVAVGAGITIEAVEAATKYADALHKVSTEAGLSAEQLQVYRRAAEETGASSEDVDQGLANLAKQLAEAQTGSKDAAKSFAALGITLKSGDTVGSVLPEIIESLSQVQDKGERAAVEVKLFGQAGAELDEMLSGGNQQISDLAKNLQATGQILSSSDIQHLNEVSKQIAGLKAQLMVDISSVVAKNADTIIMLANAFAKLADAGLKAIGAVADFLKSPWGAIQFAINPAGAVAQAITQRAISGDPAKGNGFTLKGAQYMSDDQFRQQFQARGNVKPNDALLRSLNAPAGRHPRGKSADQLENEADQRTKRYQDQLYGLQDEQLRLQEDMNGDIGHRADIEKQLADNADKRRIDDINAQRRIDLRNAPKDADLINKRADTLIGQINDNASYRHDNEKTQLANDLTDQLAKNYEDRLAVDNELLDSEQALARTAKDRLSYALRALENDKNRERADLQNQIDTAKPGTDVSSQRNRLSNLDVIYANRAKGLQRQNAGPWGDYVNSLPRTADEINEAFQQAAVSGVERLNDSLDNSIAKMLHLHGVAGEFLKDLIQIGLHALEGQLFGSGNASPSAGGQSGGGGFFSTIVSAASSIFGGARAGGGPVLPGKIYRVNERGEEYFSPSVPGTIIPNHAISAINPNMRVSSPAVAGPVIHQTIQYSGAVDIADKNYVNQMGAVIASQTRTLVGQSSAQTLARAPGAVRQTQTLKG